MDVGLLSLGDLLPDPNSGDCLSPSQRHRAIVESAVLAEQAGLASVWLGEHHFCDYILSAPPVVLAAVGERTRAMRLGTGVALLPHHDPVRLAEDYATVDALSGGRVDLVVGRGVLRRTYADFGQDADQSREMFAEKLELLVRLWSEEDVHWSGKFRAPLEGVTVHPRPVQTPHPPIWVGGGSSNASVDLAARLGLALMLPSVLAPPDAFLPLVDRYRERSAAAGHDPARIRVGACSHVHVAADSQTARERWKPYHMHYIGWVMGTLLPWGGLNVSTEGGLPMPSFDFDHLIRGPSICGSSTRSKMSSVVPGTFTSVPPKGMRSSAQGAKSSRLRNRLIVKTK